MNTYLRIDGVLANPDYNYILDKEWTIVVSQVEKGTCNVIDRRKITVHKLARGFDTPELSEVIADIEKCKTIDEIIDKVCQNKPTNDCFKKEKAVKDLPKDREMDINDFE